jgi:hypothetical protein
MVRTDNYRYQRERADYLQAKLKAAEEVRDLAIEGSRKQMVRAEALQDKLDRAQVALRVALGDSHELTMPEVRAIAATQPSTVPDYFEGVTLPREDIPANAVPTYHLSMTEQKLLKKALLASAAPTPETDAEYERLYGIAKNANEAFELMAKFACSLERRLRAALDKEGK